MGATTPEVSGPPHRKTLVFWEKGLKKVDLGRGGSIYIYIRMYDTIQVYLLLHPEKNI